MTKVDRRQALAYRIAAHGFHRDTAELGVLDLGVQYASVPATAQALAARLPAGAPAAGLAELAALEEQLPGYHYLPAVRADLLRQLDRDAEAVAAYEQALTLAVNDAERAFLTGRLADLTTRRRTRCPPDPA